MSYMTFSVRLKALIRFYVFQNFDSQVPASFTEALYWTLWGPLLYEDRKGATHAILALFVLLLLYWLLWPASISSHCPPYSSEQDECGTFVVAQNRLIYCAHNGVVYDNPFIVLYSNTLQPISGQRCGQSVTLQGSKFVRVRHSGNVEGNLDQFTSKCLQRFFLFDPAGPAPPNCFVS